MAQIKIASGMKGYNKTALTMTFVLTLMCLAGLQLLVGMCRMAFITIQNPFLAASHAKCRLAPGVDM